MAEPSHVPDVIVPVPVISNRLPFVMIVPLTSGRAMERDDVADAVAREVDGHLAQVKSRFDADLPTRFIGLTGHHDPDVLVEAMRRYSFDSVLLPVNPADRSIGSISRTSQGR